MQNRYVGDIGDYVKLAILRALSGGPSARRLGVAWWFFPDEDRNADGGHREYLQRPDKWKRFDPVLFDALRAINDEKTRNVSALEDAALFSNVVFARNPIPCDIRPFAQRLAARRSPEAALRKAEREAENIKQAVRHGKATATLLDMLEAAEAKIERLRAECTTEPLVSVPVDALPEAVERYARELRRVMGRDTDRARFPLSRLLGDVILRPDRQGLVAEVRGNLAVLLEDLPSIGAGSPSRIVPYHRAQVSWLPPSQLRRPTD
jgi:hypothetical protein